MLTLKGEKRKCSMKKTVYRQQKSIKMHENVWSVRLSAGNGGEVCYSYAE